MSENKEITISLKNKKIDILLNQLEKQLQIHKHADRKAYLILAILGFIAWKTLSVFILTYKTLNNGSLSVNIFTGVILSILIIILLTSYNYSTIFAFKTIIPRTTTLKENLFYFGYVAKKTPAEIAEKMRSTTYEDLLNALSYEYTIASKITVEKLLDVKKATKGAIISVISFAILYTIYNFIQNPQRTEKPPQKLQHTSLSISFKTQQKNFNSIK